MSDRAELLEGPRWPVSPTVTVEPLADGSDGVYVVRCAGVAITSAVRQGNGTWHRCASPVRYESLFALVDDYLAAQGVQEYQLDASRVRGAA